MAGFGAGAAGVGMSVLGSMGISVHPFADGEMFGEVGNAMGALSGSEFGKSFASAAKATNADFEVGVHMAKGVIAGLEEVLSGKPIELKEVFNMGEDIFGPLAKSLEGVMGKVPILGSYFKTMYEDVDKLFGLSTEWLSVVSELGNMWQEVAREISGETIDPRAIDGLTKSVQELFSTGAIVRSGDVINSIGEIHARLGMAGETLEEFTRVYSEANELLGTTLNLDNLTGAFNAFGVPIDQSVVTLEKFANILRDSGADGNALLHTIKTLGPSFVELGYSLPQMSKIFTDFSKMGITIDRLSFAFAGMIDKAAKAVNAGKADNILEVYDRVLDAMKKMSDQGDIAGAISFGDSFFGPKGGQIVLQGIQREALKTADAMNHLYGVGGVDKDNKYGVPLEEDVEKTRSLEEAFAALQRQMEAGFAPVGKAFADVLGEMSGGLSKWLQTHQVEIVKWSTDITVAAINVFSKVTQGFGAAMKLLAVPMEAVKDLMIASFAPVTLAIDGALRLISLLPDGFMGIKNQDVTDLVDSADTILKGMKEGFKFDLYGAMKDGGDFLSKTALESLKVIPEIQEKSAEAQKELAISESFLLQDTNKNGKIATAVQATSTGDIVWKEGAFGSDAQKEIEKKLLEQGITITQMDKNVIKKVEAQDEATARVFQEFLYWINGGKPIKTEVYADGKLVVPDPAKVSEKEKPKQVDPYGALRDQVAQEGVLPIPAQMEHSAFAPQMRADDWFPSGVRPAAWDVSSDGTLQVPAQLNPADRSEARIQNVSSLMDAMGIPSQNQGPTGVVMSVAFQPTGGVGGGGPTIGLLGNSVATGQGVNAAISYAQTEGNGQPYAYGGAGTASAPGEGRDAGNPGFDCSGYIASVWGVMTGRGPGRWFNTESDFTALGFKRGTKSGAFNIGVHNGGGGRASHMAATLPNGTNIESGGSHNSTLYGGAALGADAPQFENKYYYEVGVAGAATIPDPSSFPAQAPGKSVTAGGGGSGFSEIASPAAAADFHARNLEAGKLPGGGSDYNHPKVLAAAVKPHLIVLHTEEGDSSAQQLAASMQGSGKSYHYIIDKDGKLVVDAVDPSQASKSVFDPGNNQSINIAMAGTHADWNRVQWLAREAQLKTTAAIAARVGKEQGIDLGHLGMDDGSGSGIVGHDWISKFIGVTDHTDPGKAFPWDVFEGYVREAAGIVNTGASAPLPQRSASDYGGIGLSNVSFPLPQDGSTTDNWLGTDWLSDQGALFGPNGWLTKLSQVNRDWNQQILGRDTVLPKEIADWIPYVGEKWLEADRTAWGSKPDPNAPPPPKPKPTTDGRFRPPRRSSSPDQYDGLFEDDGPLFGPDGIFTQFDQANTDWNRQILGRDTVLPKEIADWIPYVGEKWRKAAEESDPAARRNRRARRSAADFGGVRPANVEFPLNPNFGDPDPGDPDFNDMPEIVSPFPPSVDPKSGAVQMPTVPVFSSPGGMEAFPGVKGPEGFERESPFSKDPTRNVYDPMADVLTELPSFKPLSDALANARAALGDTAVADVPAIGSGRASINAGEPIADSWARDMEALRLQFDAFRQDYMRIPGLEAGRAAKINEKLGKLSDEVYRAQFEGSSAAARVQINADLKAFADAMRTGSLDAWATSGEGLGGYLFGGSLIGPAGMGRTPTADSSGIGLTPNPGVPQAPLKSEHGGGHEAAGGDHGEGGLIGTAGEGGHGEVKPHGATGEAKPGEAGSHDLPSAPLGDSHPVGPTQPDGSPATTTTPEKSGETFNRPIEGPGGTDGKGTDAGKPIVPSPATVPVPDGTAPGGVPSWADGTGTPPGPPAGAFGPGPTQTPSGMTPGYNPYSNPPPYGLTPEQWESWIAQTNARAAEENSRKQRSEQRDKDIADLQTKISVDLQKDIEDAKNKKFGQGQMNWYQFQQKLKEGVDPKSLALYEGYDEMMAAVKTAEDRRKAAQDTLAEKIASDKTSDQSDAAASAQPWPKPPKQETVKPDQYAEQLGKGLVKGVFQELGFDGSLFENFMDWGITKMFTKTLNYGAGIGLRVAQSAETGQDVGAALASTPPFPIGGQPGAGNTSVPLGVVDGVSQALGGGNVPATSGTGMVPPPADVTAQTSHAGGPPAAPPLPAEAGGGPVVAPASYHVNVPQAFPNRETGAFVVSALNTMHLDNSRAVPQHI